MAEGIAFPYHVQVGNKINFNKKLAKLKKVLNAWSSRHLTILGRIAIVKSLALAKLVYKVKNDHRSKFSNLRNWKEEAWKNQGFNGIRTRDLRDTGAMLYQLSYEATH